MGHSHSGALGYIGVGDAMSDWRDKVGPVRTSSQLSKAASEKRETHDDDEDYDDEDDDSCTSEMCTDSSEESASASHLGRGGGGIREWCPRVYKWFMARTTARQKLMALTIFIALNCSKFMMFEFAVQNTVNICSFFVVVNFSSLTLALLLSFIFEGQRAFGRIFHRYSLLRFFVAALLFACSTLSFAVSFMTGMSPTVIILLGKLYLPVSAVCSMFAFGTRYSVLEWLSIAMLMLGITAFLLLRYLCDVNDCQHLEHLTLKAAGVIAMLASITCSPLASIIAEGLEKDKHIKGNFKRARVRYFICRAQLDLWSTIIWLVIWVVQVNFLPFTISAEDDNVLRFSHVQGKDSMWLGHWTKRHFILVFVLAGQGWLAGVVVQHYSTVSKGVAQTLSAVLVVMLGDPILGKFDFGKRFIPSLMISLIVILSALIFQTGRINMRAMRSALKEQAKVHFKKPRELLTNVRTGVKRMTWQSSSGINLCSYSTIILYVLADSFRSTVMYIVQANRFFVPQTMSVMSGVCGVAFASAMTFNRFGTAGLAQAWSFRKIRKFLVCGALQAVTSSLMSLAYALGTTPALVVALGRVYIPLVAVFSWCILGKYFMWLEWFALVILTVASAAFGMMETLDGGGSSRDTPVFGMLCVIMSATSSCLMSLVMEKVMKGQTDPYIMQKVRLDLVSVVFSLIFLPVMGFLGCMPGNARTDLAYWSPRSGPDYWECQSVAIHTSSTATNGCDLDTGEFLVNWTKVGNSSALHQTASACVCRSGVLLGWGSNYMIYICLFFIVFHGWITGLLVTQFSSVYRAVADGIPVLLIYFILDPLFSRVPLAPFRSAYSSMLPFPPKDWARDCVCFILPLSGWTFSMASDEMQKISDLIHASDQDVDSPTAQTEAHEEVGDQEVEDEDEDDSDFDGSTSED